MKVRDHMTRDVVTVTPTTRIHEVASLMVNHRVSGLPVLDEKGCVVGIVTEADLLVRQKRRARVSWLRFFLTGAERLAREFQRAVETTAGEVMTREVISIGPDLPIEAAAAVLHERGIRRVPVVADGVLVGILSRGDLVKALAGPPRAPAPASDARLVEAMKACMAAEPWVPRGLIVEAAAGVLTLQGLVGTQAERAAFETMARSIPGIKGVDNQLVVHAPLPSGV